MMNNRNCPTCNHELSNKFNYCPNCGTAISKKAQEKTKKEPVKGKSNPKRDMIIIAGIIVIAVAGYFIINRPENAPQSNQQVDFDHPDVGLEMGEMGTGLNLPSDYNSLVQMGHSFMDQSNFPMAAECYKRALTIDGSSNDVRTDYGACLHGMNLPERAIQEFYKVIKNDPNHGIANFNLGIVYYTSNKPDSARHYWKRYLEIDPNGSAAPTARAKLQELGG